MLFRQLEGHTAIYVDNNMNTNDNRNPAKRISKRQNEGNHNRPAIRKYPAYPTPLRCTRVCISYLDIDLLTHRPAPKKKTTHPFQYPTHIQ